MGGGRVWGVFDLGCLLPWEKLIRLIFSYFISGVGRLVADCKIDPVILPMYQLGKSLSLSLSLY